MSENEINRILGALSEAKESHSRQLAGIHNSLESIKGNLANLNGNGCGKYPDHMKAQADLLEHDKRLSVLESDKKAVVWLGTIFGGVAGLIVTWLKK
jgi:hypothetical protein